MERRLRYRDLEALGIVTNRVTLHNWIRKCGFPPGQLTGPNQRTWGEDEVRAWLATRPVQSAPLRGEPARRVRRKAERLAATPQA
jgi:predicted DNA-binding transcriptional regulator AlpA